jgi:thymidine kinase
MNSSKTANLLMTVHNYESLKKRPLLIKPKLDDRFGENIVKSRCGLQKKADLIIDENYKLLENNITYSDYDVILVDECNFLTPAQIDELRILTLKLPVICYGLRTNYLGKLFPASCRLLEISDSIEEIKTLCNFCDKKAIMNMKHNNGQIITEGTDEPDLGTEDKYLAVCWKCWYNFTTLKLKLV